MEKEQEDFKKVPWFGAWNPILKDFCLRETSLQAPLDNKDKRKIETGKRCANMTRDVLLKVIIESKGFPVLKKPGENVKERAEIALKGSVDHLSWDEQVQAAVYGDWDRISICEMIHREFVKRDMVKSDNNCGNQQKQKYFVLPPRVRK